MKFKMEDVMDNVFQWAWLPMCSGLGFFHAVLCEEEWYNAISAVIGTVIYVTICMLAYLAILYTALYLREQAEIDTFARTTVNAISIELVKDYRAQATYHELCKFVFFDIYKKGSSDIFIDLYLVQSEKKEDKTTYRKIPYMVFWFFLRAKHYPTPEDFKRAIFNTVKDAFDGEVKNDVLIRSSFVKERSLKAFLDQCKEKPLLMLASEIVQEVQSN